MAAWKRYRWEMLPFLSAFFLILSFPPVSRGCLAWVSLIPLFFYCRGQASPGKCFRGGFITGLLFFLHLYAYIALSVNFVLPRYVGILVVVAAALYSALFYGIFALLLFFFLQGTVGVLSALATPAAWVLLEYLRGTGLLGHTGGFLGYSQSYNPLLQCISLYGYWGLPFLMVLFQVFLFLAWHCYKTGPHTHIKQGGRQTNKNPQGTHISNPAVRPARTIFKAGQKKAGGSSSSSGRTLTPVLVVFAIMLGSGIYFPSLFPPQEKARPLRIALVQGNIPQGNILDASLSADIFQKYLKLSEKADSLYAPLDLIVWPETVFSTSLARQHPGAEKEIAALAEKTGSSILYGAMCEDNPPGNVFNSILLCQGGEALPKIQRTDKLRLVPFAEYFPFPEILNSIWKMDISLGTYTPGDDPQTFRLADFAFGGIICFESYFSQPARLISQKGGEHIFVLSNDAWFLASSGLEQHARAAAIRALETGRGVTQVANTGYTVSFDCLGREILKLPARQVGIALLETKIPRRQTFYLLWGNYFLYCCLLLLVAQIISFLAQRKKSTKEIFSR